MDRTFFWISLGIIILLAVIGVAGFVIWIAWQKEQRERLGDNGEEYHRIAPPRLDSPLHRRPPIEIQWGNEEQPSRQYPPTVSSSDVREMPLCPLCKHIINLGEGISCPNCNEKYHSSCWSEYNKTCVICRKEES